MARVVLDHARLVAQYILLPHFAADARRRLGQVGRLIDRDRVAAGRIRDAAQPFSAHRLFKCSGGR